MKQLKDYLPLYLGCECQSIHGILKGTLMAVRVLKGLENAFIKYEGQVNLIPFKSDELKLILRTTQSVTHYEWGMAPKGSFHVGFEGCFYTPELFIYLLSLKIDLFGLIEAGLAIDANTLK